MKEKIDNYTYLIGLGSLLLSVFAVFFENEEISRILLLIGGLAGLVIFIVFLYTNKIDNLQKDLNTLKKEYKYTKEIIEIKHRLKNLEK